MARLLVSNNNLNTQQIGEVVDTKPFGNEWGGREGLPNYVHIDITDSTREQDSAFFLEQWEIEYKIEIQVDNPQLTRYLIEVAAVSISASGVGKDQLKSGMQQWAENQYGGTVLAFTPETFTVTVPKPFDHDKFVSDFADIWNVIFDIRRYHFSQSDVDDAIAAGGLISYTFADATTRIIDKKTL